VGVPKHGSAAACCRRQEGAEGGDANAKCNRRHAGRQVVHPTSGRGGGVGGYARRGARPVEQLPQPRPRQMAPSSLTAQARTGGEEMAQINAKALASATHRGSTGVSRPRGRARPERRPVLSAVGAADAQTSRWGGGGRTSEDTALGYRERGWGGAPQAVRKSGSLLRPTYFV